jgi:hypothetical protein
MKGEFKGLIKETVELVLRDENGNIKDHRIIEYEPKPLFKGPTYTVKTEV